jgi:hypothetical protein
LSIATANQPKPLDAAATPQPRETACLNCGAPLAGPFCSACGQRNIPPYPSLRELVVDAFWELSGWDGRFAATVRELFRHPGQLTREFLEGRRARYISPLRLYLMASLVYFLAAAFVSKDSGLKINATGFSDSTIVAAPVGAAPREGSAPARVAEAVAASARSGSAPDSAKAAQAFRDIARAPAILRPFLRRLVVDPKGFQRGLVEAMPRLFFVLVPVFAAIVALFYHGRKYSEHLYFAIHVHSFVFLVLLLKVAARLTHVAAIASVAAFVVFVWIPTYSTIAFRRLYGGTVTGTLVKEAGIGILYFVASVVALLATVYAVAVWG